MGNWIEYHPNPRAQVSKIKPAPEQQTILNLLQHKHLALGEALCDFWSEYFKLPAQLFSLTVTSFTYGELMDANDRETPVAQVELNVAQGFMHWYFDYGLAQAFLERALGGRGYLGKRPEAMTALEATAFQTVLEDSSAIFSKLWALNLNFSMEAVKTPKLFFNSNIPNQEPYHLITMEVKLGQEAPARISLGYTAQAFAELMKLWGSQPSRGNAIQIKPQTAQKIMVPMTVNFGVAEARLREVAELQVGDIIVLKNKPSEAVKVLMGDQAKLLAKPGQKDRHWSVQVLSYDEEEPAIRLPRLDEQDVDVAPQNHLDDTDSPFEENSSTENTEETTEETSTDSIWDDDDDFSWDDDTENK
jgi:flagellar motor switch protein FliM